jgi:hypothetical protein
MGSMNESRCAKEVFDMNEALDRVAGDRGLLKEIAHRPGRYGVGPCPERLCG